MLRASRFVPSAAHEGTTALSPMTPAQIQTKLKILWHLQRAPQMALLRQRSESHQTQTAMVPHRTPTAARMGVIRHTLHSQQTYMLARAMIHSLYLTLQAAQTCSMFGV